ncbi:MAG: dTDP-4-dehydrorhamnose reductase [Planctomycetes bacterium]|nr:dTDP-4-dehydrorhamnose reductase [Planctomycetota bacterium]
MRIALIGAGGQLGTALMARLEEEVLPLGSRDLDIADPEQVQRVIPELRAELVINTAAYNFVDKAEDEAERARAVNETGPKLLAETCARLDIPLVHIGTDYVYGGAHPHPHPRPYVETDPATPSSVYSRSKLAGEQAVIAHCPKHYVLRTCGLYGRAVSAGKGNFVQTMLRLGRERGAVSVVDDQWCTPTFATDLAGAIADLITTGKYGLYHATNSGSTTWCGFAREIFRLQGMAVPVTPITTAQFKAKAARPSYSVLDCAKLTNVLGRQLRSWHDALAEYLATT